MSDIKIRFLGELDGQGSLTARAIAATLEARVVDNADDADIVVLKPIDLEDLLEDAAATAAFHATRDQESVPADVVTRLVARENPVKVWRGHRGLSQRVLAERTGLSFTYLSQIENNVRKGSMATMKKLAAALGVDIDDLV